MPESVRILIRRPVRALGVLCGILAGVGLATGILAGCRRQPNSVSDLNRAPAASRILAQSKDCRRCHEEIYTAWEGSHHARAHRPVDAALDADAFQPARDFVLHGVGYHTGWENGGPTFSEARPGGHPDRYTADFVLGYSPLRQYIVAIGGGRYQANELAFDPVKKDWFDVFGDEQRQPGEWGHWRGRGMNWNSMCAACHMTDFRKNYDAASDTYASRWSEHGVGCMQCHASLPADHATRPPKPAAVAQTTEAARRTLAQESCAPCHARNEFLSGDILPGAAYADHYRLTLPVEPGVFYADGQMRDEDFNMTSFLTSRMGGKAGVTCLDCHNPHNGKTILPVENNQLCLQCHGSPGRLNAPVIEPSAHSHHGARSAGNLCVSCHMPTTIFMQRDARHDHGFLKPDPLLTKELGIPNACNRCHADKSPDWAISATSAWYGAKMESRQRERTRAVVAAQSGVADGAPALLGLMATEEVPAWKATLLLLARPYADDAAVLAAASSALGAADPLVRSAAVQVIGSRPGNNALLRPLLKDPSRLVRVDAEWSLSGELADDSPERQELNAYLAAGSDQPAGRMRQGQDLFNRGKVSEAEAPLKAALSWDSNSPVMHDALATVLQGLGREGESASEFWKAAQLLPTDADAAFRAALAFAGARQFMEAETALREAVRRNPRHDRAWYNLGLLLAQTGRADGALEALRTAESLAPSVPDYPYAAATILLQRGDPSGAVGAARRALKIDPNYEPATNLLQQAGR